MDNPVDKSVDIQAERLWILRPPGITGRRCSAFTFGSRPTLAASAAGFHVKHSPLAGLRCQIRLAVAQLSSVNG